MLLLAGSLLKARSLAIMCDRTWPRLWPTKFHHPGAGLEDGFHGTASRRVHAPAPECSPGPGRPVVEQGAGPDPAEPGQVGDRVVGLCASVAGPDVENGVDVRDRCTLVEEWEIGQGSHPPCLQECPSAVNLTRLCDFLVLRLAGSSVECREQARAVAEVADGRHEHQSPGARPGGRGPGLGPPVRPLPASPPSGTATAVLAAPLRR